MASEAIFYSGDGFDGGAHRVLYAISKGVKVYFL